MGSSRRNSVEHVGEILLVDAADALQGSEITARDELQMRDKGLHGRVEAVELTQLDGKAFRKRAGADSRGLEGLHEGEHARHGSYLAAEPVGDGVDILAEVAGLVDGIDQVAADQAAHGVGGGEVELALQMLVEGDVAGQPGLEIGRFAVVPAGTDVRPGRRHHRNTLATLEPRPVRGAGLVGEDIVETGVEIRFHGGAIGLQVLREPRLGRLPVPSVGVAAVLACRLEAGRAVPLGIPVAVNSLQQRVALELRLPHRRQGRDGRAGAA